MMTNSAEGNWPEMISGFEHISRNWDTVNDVCSAKILPGEYYVTKSPEMIQTVLGSCVSACIRDLDTGVGGMNHFMLPKATDKPGNWSMETRYGLAAMELLINDILKQGARKRRLEIKLFGGGEILNMHTSNVGARNVEFALEFMRVEGYDVSSQDLGGPHPRKVMYFPQTGKVMVRKLRAIQAQAVCDQERNYETKIDTKSEPGEIELFS